MRVQFPRLLLVLVLWTGFAFALASPDDQPIENPLARPVRKRPKIAPQPTDRPAAALSDAEALTKAKLNPDDGQQLLEYLKQRTLTDADQTKIGGIIARFGADDFEEREKAAQEILAYGSAAIGPLKKAERDSDPEIAYRARYALRRLETIPHAAVAAAAVRAVARLKPDGAAAVLIGFLPVADSEPLMDTIRQALVELAVNNGKAEPALLAALADPLPLRRAAAYVALTNGGNPNERIRIKDAYPKVREAVLKESDPEAKFTGLWALALTTREKEYIPELVRMIPTLSRGRIWQLEELLLALAGTHPKDGRFLKSPESLAKTRDVWLAWWKEKGASLDFAALDFKPRVQGLTDIIEMDYRGYGQGRIVCLGPDLKEKWAITGVNNPTDMRVAANGNIWVVESNNNLITERTTTGEVISRRNAFQQPLNLDFTPDGGMIVVCRNNILCWDKDGRQVWSYPRNNYDIMAGRLLPNGEVLFLTNLYQQPNAPRNPNSFRIGGRGNDAGKELPDTKDEKRRLSLGWIQQLQCIDVVGDDRILVCEREVLANGQQIDRVSEYEFKTGKQTWKYDCPLNSAPTSAQRLPNGNTLISLMNQNRVIEVDPSGEIVWEHQAKDGLRVGRAYRR